MTTVRSTTRLLAERPLFVFFMMACLILGLLIVPSSCAATEEASIKRALLDEKACLQAGFDPFQLSCETCEILMSLPSSMKTKCQDCCLSYKTLERKAEKYDAVVITNIVEMQHFFPEVETLLNEDMESILDQKGGSKPNVIVKNISSSRQPPALYWFKTGKSGSTSFLEKMTITEIRDQAAMTTPLEGWKRDEIRDMILALVR